MIVVEAILPSRRQDLRTGCSFGSLGQDRSQSSHIYIYIYIYRNSETLRNIQIVCVGED